MSDAKIDELVRRFFAGNLTPSEAEELLDRVRHTKDDTLKAALEEVWKTYEPSPAEMAAGGPAMERVYARLFPEKVVTVRRPQSWWRPAAAAAVIVAAAAGLWLWQRPLSSPLPAAPATAVHDAMPGGEKAVLTLSNGRQIVLDSAANGTLANQNGSSVSKLANGQLAYNDDAASGEVVYNTMTTPRGGQYRLTLPDGTRAWINSASSITFPTAFRGNTRNITVTGEVYLEVEKDPARPFLVKAGGVEVAVLGTHFNINAYKDEAAVSTTLLEGKVKVNANGDSRMIAPGEQARVNKTGGMTVERNVNLEKIMAWKNGRFVFEGESIGTVMRQLSRWYDMEVEAAGEIDDRFYLDIPRSKKLSDVLKALELTGKVKFSISTNKITVMK